MGKVTQRQEAGAFCTSWPSACCGPGMLAFTKRDWRGTRAPPRLGPPGRLAGADRRLPEPHLLVRPARVGALPLRQRPPAAVPRQGVGVPGAGRRADHPRRRPDPGLPRDRRTPRSRCATRSRAVEKGECVVVYPEGTITRDPGLWPMTGKTGAARIALATGAPVIPVAQWGAQDVHRRPTARSSALLPRKTMQVSGRARRSTSTTCAVATSTPTLLARGHRRASWRRSPRCSRRSAARQAPAERYDLQARATQPRRQDAGTTRRDVGADARRGHGQRVVGHGVRHGARRRRQRGRDLGPRRRARRRHHRPRAREREVPARASCCPTRCGPPPTPPTRSTAPTIVVLAVPAQSLRDNLATWNGLVARDSVLVSLMKGIEQGTTHADEPGGRARSSGVELSRIAVVSGPEPGPGDRRSASRPRPPSRAPTRRVAERRRRRLHHGVLPALLDHRRRGHRDRRRR